MTLILIPKFRCSKKEQMKNNLAEIPLVEILKAQTVVEKEGIKARLESEGITCFTETRDMIVNLDNGPNLSLGGYSAFFDGYKVFVKKEDVTRAKTIVSALEKSRVDEKETPDYAKKFMMSCLLSFTLPVIMNILAIYHFVMARKNHQKIRYSMLIPGFALWFFSMGCISLFIISYF